MRHFTIIIPTRNRHDTLLWTIKSCLAQDYERMTVLVSDNCSTDATPEVIDSFRGDPRFKAVRTPAPTSMSANIEFAIGHCVDQDTHVTGLGDDDGLMPGGLAYANEVLAEHPDTEALTWCMSTYNWPSALVEAWQNQLHLSLGEGVTRMVTTDMLARLRRCDVYYHHLPGLWSSLVSTRVLRRCISRAGRVIIGNIPDAASAVHIACQTEGYLFSQRSVALIGSSSHSNGMKEAVGDKAATAQFYGEATIPFNRRMIPAPAGPNYCAEALWMAHDAGLLPDGLTPDMERVIRLLLIRPETMTDEVYAHVCDAAERMAAMNGVTFDRDAFLRLNEEEKAAEKLFNDPIVTGSRVMISHRCDPSNVRNIVEAGIVAGEFVRAHQSKCLLTHTEHRQALSAAKQKLEEKIDKGRDRISKLERKLQEAGSKRKSGFFARLGRLLGGRS